MVQVAQDVSVPDALIWGPPESGKLALGSSGTRKAQSLGIFYGCLALTLLDV